VTDEREVQDDPVVLEGEDEFPRQPAPPLDPYTPEPGPRRGEKRAFNVLWLAWLVVVVLVAFVVWAALR
jgi:hypothetical protein